MKKFLILLIAVIIFSLQSSTPKNVMRTSEPSAPYKNDDGSYTQQSTQPSAPAQPAHVTMIVDMHGFKQTISYDCHNSVERFHADVESIVQQVQTIIQPAFLKDIRPHLREHLLNTLYENLEDKDFTVYVTINDQECSVLKKSSSSATSYYIVNYTYDAHPGVTAQNKKNSRLGIFARCGTYVRNMYHLLAD